MTQPNHSMAHMRERYQRQLSQQQAQPEQAGQTAFQPPEKPQPAAQQDPQPAAQQPQPAAQQPQAPQQAPQRSYTPQPSPSQAAFPFDASPLSNDTDDSGFSVGEELHATRAQTTRSKEGWRGLLNRTFGANLSQTRREREWGMWVSQINRTARYPVIIGVVSGKGGQGKSLTTLMVASAIAEQRGKTVAVDLDYSSTLIHRLRAVTGRTERRSIGSFALDPNVVSNTDVDAYLNFNDRRLGVLGGIAVDPSTVSELNRDIVVTALTRLAKHYSFIFVDLPGAREAEQNSYTLPLCDALILVTSPRLVALASAHHYLHQLRERYPALIANTLVVVSHPDKNPPEADLEAEVGRLRRDIEAGDGKRVYNVPFDAHLAEDRPIDFDRVSDVVRRRYMHIAADLVATVPCDDVTHIARLSGA